MEINLDSDDDDLEIVAEKRLTHKPVEKSPLEILVEQQKGKGEDSEALWSKIEKNTDKIAIQSFTVPRGIE